jgi:hypothetical protein
MPPLLPQFFGVGGAIMSPLLSDLSDEGTALPIHLILKVTRDKTHVSRYRTLKKHLQNNYKKTKSHCFKHLK